VRTLGDTTLAAVWTPNPNHPLTWVNFIGYLLLIVGGVIVVTGVVTTALLARGRGERKWGDYVIGPFILGVGLAVAYAGVQLS